MSRWLLRPIRDGTSIRYALAHWRSSRSMLQSRRKPVKAAEHARRMQACEGRPEHRGRRWLFALTSLASAQIPSARTAARYARQLRTQSSKLVFRSLICHPMTSGRRLASCRARSRARSRAEQTVHELRAVQAIGGVAACAHRTHQGPRKLPSDVEQPGGAPAPCGKR